MTLFLIPPGMKIAAQVTPEPVEEDLKFLRTLEIANSPNVSMCLCVGCWLEGGKRVNAEAENA